MKNLELYAGLLAGGLGTGYNLIQGDSLPSALAQGAILGSAVGGGMYGADKLMKATTVPLDIQPITETLDDVYTYNIPADIRMTLTDSLGMDGMDGIDDGISKLKRQSFDYYNKAYKYKNKLNDTIDYTIDYINQQQDIIDNSAKYLGVGTGLIGGMAVNDLLFKDKSDREKEQLLLALRAMKNSGMVSPYIDDYLAKNGY